MINITYIYLVENCFGNSNWVYIGKTINIKDRNYNHRITYGEQIEYSIIDQINSLEHKAWKPLESYWIEQLRQWGFEVINKNDGGGGPSFRTEDERRRISKSKMGKQASSETKLKMSISNSKPKPVGFGDKLKKPNANPTTYGIPVSQYDLQGNFIKIWPSRTLASRTLNVAKSSITENCKGTRKSAGGWIWKAE
jgi:hypothetical protein